MKKLLSSLLLFAIMVAAPTGVAAQSGIGLTPAITEVVLNESDKSVEFNLTISNSTNQTVDISLSTQDFGSLDESGGIAFLGKTSQETSGFGLSRWMKLSKSKLNLEPNSSQDVRVTVENESSLSPGGHYGAVIVTAGSDKQADSVSVLPAGSTLVLLKKQGGEIYELNLNNVNTNKSLISLPNKTELSFENTGNVHMVPRGTISLFSPTGSLISTGIINQQSSFVLPDSSRLFNTGLDVTRQPWLPGRYKLEVNWRYDGTGEFETTTQHFWYIGKLVIYIFIALCLVTVFIMFRKWRNNPIVRGQ